MSEWKELLEEALRELGETIGYEKLMDIFIAILKKVDSNLIRKLGDKLKEEQ